MINLTIYILILLYLRCEYHLYLPWKLGCNKSVLSNFFLPSEVDEKLIDALVFASSVMCNNDGVLFAGWRIRFFDQFFSPIVLSLFVNNAPFLKKRRFSNDSDGKDSLAWYLFAVVLWCTRSSRSRFKTERPSVSKRLKHDLAARESENEKISVIASKWKKRTI